MNKCKLCDNEVEMYVNNIPLCKKHYEQKNEIEEKEKQHLTLAERNDLNKISYLSSEIEKKTGLKNLTEAIGKLRDREYRAMLAVMYRKPHYFKEYVMKNLINQNNFNMKYQKTWRDLQTDKYADLKIKLLFVFILIGALISNS